MIDQQGVAVRVGAHRAAGADSAASAAGVLDRDLLAENFRHGLRGDARDRIGRPARGRGDDDVDRPRRVVLRRSGADHGPKRRGDREQTHRVSSRGACFGAYDISNHWAANPPLSRTRRIVCPLFALGAKRTRRDPPVVCRLGAKDPKADLHAALCASREPSVISLDQ